MVEQPRLKRDWEGRYVQLIRQLETIGGDIFAAGEVMYVDKDYGGLHLSTVHECSECKRHFRTSIDRVSEDAVKLLPEDYVPEEPSVPRPKDGGRPSTLDALRAENERLLEMFYRGQRLAFWICKRSSADDPMLDALAERFAEGARQWFGKHVDDTSPIGNTEAETIERLRQACIQVRKWGIELASLQPEMRERRFLQLWPQINDTLREAVLQAEGE
jgi:hypothetical protein